MIFHYSMDFSLFDDFSVLFGVRHEFVIASACY